jgi:hypothetical protein
MMMILMMLLLLLRDDVYVRVSSRDKVLWGIEEEKETKSDKTIRNG